MYEMMKKIGNSIGQEVVASSTAIVTFTLTVSAFLLLGALLWAARSVFMTERTRVCDQIQTNMGYQTAMVGNYCYVAVDGKWYGKGSFELLHDKPVEQHK